MKMYKGGRIPPQVKSLNWEIVEFQVLLQQSQSLAAKLKDLLANRIFNSTYTNITTREIKAVCDEMMGYLRDMFKKKRQPPADHILVILLSDERRSKKPYALPVSYYPYSSLSDAYVRDFTCSIKSKIKEQNLNVVGMYIMELLLDMPYNESFTIQSLFTFEHLDMQ